MKRSCYFLLLLIMFSCNSKKDAGDKKPIDLTTANDGYHSKKIIPKDTPAVSAAAQNKPTVLVMPPHDVIANEGISPDVQKYLQAVLAKDTGSALIKFPYKQLMGVPYQHVFDKKYCTPILEKVKADVVIMSKIELVKRNGRMDTDEWNLQLNIYNTRTGSQKISSLQLERATIAGMEHYIQVKATDLFAEIR